MTVDSRFPTKLNAIQDAPEPFANALLEKFAAPDRLRLLIHAPSFATPDESAPATVLAIGEEGWLLASKGEGETLSVDQHLFVDTLFVELTTILLWGQLRIDYSSVGTSYSGKARFDTVGKELYLEAINLILEGIERGTSGRPAAPASGDDPAFTAALEDWPLHFRNEALTYRPWGRRLLGATRWPAVSGGFRRELAPAAALLVTGRELVLMADEKTPAWSQGIEDAKFGGIITYFPLVRLADYHVSHLGPFSALALEVHAVHGGERLEILFPSDHEKSVVKTMEQARAAVTG